MSKPAVPAKNNNVNSTVPVKLMFKDHLKQTVKYFAFAASAGVIQEGTFFLFMWLNAFSFMENPYWPRYLISLVLAVTWNFTFNRRFTYKSANNIPVAMLKILGYYAVFTPLSLWLGVVLTNGQPDSVHSIVQVSTFAFNGITEFIFMRFVVFRGSINTMQEKTEK